MPLATDSNPNSNKRGMGEDPQNALKVNIAGVEARLRVATATAEQLLKVATDGADDRAELHFKLYVEERRHCADLAAELDELKTGLTALSPQEEHHRGDADDEEEEEEERLVKKPRTAVSPPSSLAFHSAPSFLPSLLPSFPPSL